MDTAHLDDKPTQAEHGPTRSVRARRFGRLAMWTLFNVTAGAAIVLTFELVLRGAGYRQPSGSFIEATVDGKPSWITNPAFVWRFIPPALARRGVPHVLPEAKPANAYRIFVFGGSAALGSPNFSQSAAHFLEVMLDAALPGTDFEVINLAISGVNSHVMRAAARDAAQFSPDLYVVYMGNNEVTGPYGAGTVYTPVRSSLAFIRFGLWARSTAIGQLAGGLGDGASVPKVFDAQAMFMDHRVRSTDPNLQTTYDFFQSNLNDICDAAREAGAHVLLTTVAVNTADFAPFASLHAETLGEAGLQQWDSAFGEGAALQEQGQFEGALKSYSAAESVDAEYAELYYRKGQCLAELGRASEAAKAFINARDLDTLRFRVDSRLNDIIRAVANSRVGQDVTLVDFEQEFAAGGQSAEFHDHCHFTEQGNYRLASSLYAAVWDVLPDSIRGRHGVPPPPLSFRECSHLIAYTPLTKCDDLNAILAMCSRPPFSDRLGHREWESRTTSARDQAAADSVREKLEPVVENVRVAAQSRAEDWMVQREFARLLDATEKFDEAQIAWWSAVKLMPIDAPTRFGFARALAAAGSTDDAISAYRVALTMEPENAQGHADFAKALEEKGDTAGAIAEYREHVRLLPDKGYAYVRLGEALKRSGDTAEAERAFRQGIEADPTDASIHYYLGKLFQQNGRIDESIATFERALDMEPNNDGFKKALQEARQVK